MSTLLMLPLELREEIIEYALFPPPQAKDTVWRNSYLYYLDSAELNQPTALSLFLVNHQLYSETFSVLKRTSKKQSLHHKLHLTFSNWNVLLWTWHYVPTKGHPCLELLEANICCLTTSVGLVGPTCFGTTMMGAIQRLEWLLRQFLQTGRISSMYPNGYHTDLNLRAKRLLLNFNTLPATANGEITKSVGNGDLICKFRVDVFPCNASSIIQFASELARMVGPIHRILFWLCILNFGSVQISVDGHTTKTLNFTDFVQFYGPPSWIEFMKEKRRGLRL